MACVLLQWERTKRQAVVTRWKGEDMAIIDVVEWSPHGNNVYAWRYSESNLSTATQLVVREMDSRVSFAELKQKFG